VHLAATLTAFAVLFQTDIDGFRETVGLPLTNYNAHFHASDFIKLKPVLGFGVGELTLKSESDGVNSLLNSLRLPSSVPEEPFNFFSARLHLVNAAFVIRAIEQPVAAVGVPVLRGPLTLPVVSSHSSDDSKAEIAISFLAGAPLHDSAELEDAFSVGVPGDTVTTVHRVAGALGAFIALGRAAEGDPPESVFLSRADGWLGSNRRRLVVDKLNCLDFIITTLHQIVLTLLLIRVAEAQDDVLRDAHLAPPICHKPSSKVVKLAHLKLQIPIFRVKVPHHLELHRIMVFLLHVAREASGPRFFVVEASVLFSAVFHIGERASVVAAAGSPSALVRIPLEGGPLRAAILC